MQKSEAFREAVSAFGAHAKTKLSNPAVTGAPEDQLRAPLEQLFGRLAVLVGLPANAMQMVGENALAHLNTRPDYAVVVHNALIGFIEVKAPGKGCDPSRFTDEHDRTQWKKLRSLPNIVYTDGNGFSLWQDGERVALVLLEGDIESAGSKLSAPEALLALVASFVQWQPLPPRNAQALAQVSARLCRLLRDEVAEQLALGWAGLVDLARDWRALLFPDASDAEFADGYAQAVTFGLLVARARDISLADGIERAATELRQSNTLIGTALRIFTDDAATRDRLKTSLGTLTRVLDAVSWEAVSKGNPDAWLYFYEDFLAVYDNALRRRTGSYYTPPEVVAAMVRLADDALRDPALFGQPRGLASADVTIADPAVGTGTFLLGVLRSIAATVEADEGSGAVGPAIAAAASRLIGFELQFGPFAVAQLRLLAEMQALGAPATSPRLYVTDTLGNPYAEEERLPVILQAIGRSRRDANAIKRGEPITVVIGNPPYKEKAKGRGGWIEAGSSGRAAPMDRWLPPAAWGVGAHAKHLKNLYVYFWRWATWKVFGTGLKDSTGIDEIDRAGIVCFITVAGFLNGPGFERMRDDLRRSCHDIWVIDCSPEGHQPEVATRIFQGVQQPVCIVLAARARAKDPTLAARVRYRALPSGPREEKFAALGGLSLGSPDWQDCPAVWRAPFLPSATGAWAGFPALEDFFLYNGSGVMPGRTWVIAPDADSLRRRWNRLRDERDAARKEVLFHPHEGGDRSLSKTLKSGLFGHEARLVSVGKDSADAVAPCRYAFRSFDRQWIIPDARLINRPNPTLWNWHSQRQVYLTSPEDRSPTAGPAASVTGLIPDLHHYHGRGGRAFPLWRSADGAQSNVSPSLCAYMATRLGRPVSAETLIAYLAALLAAPAFVVRFRRDLVQPGLRVPLTADAEVFAVAVELGREVIWLHCFGERFADPATGRPAAPPRLPREQAPHIPAAGSIPTAPELFPDSISHEPGKNRLHIGGGFVDNVPKAVWEYEVSGKQVLTQWFSYRRRDRSRPLIGDRRPPSPLDRVQPDRWLAEYTSELIDLLHVLGRLVALEPRQAELLERVCAGPLIGREVLMLAEALPSSGEEGRASAGRADARQQGLDL